MKSGVCGSLESNDCLITVRESKEQEIIIESIVYKYFGEQIRKVIEETLSELGLENIHVHCADRGALDYTIKSRLLEAVERMKNS